MSKYKAFDIITGLVMRIKENPDDYWKWNGDRCVTDQSKEYLVCVDRQGLPKGCELRSICHSDPAYTHRVVHVMVKDTKGNTLAQLRSRSKDIQPGKWDMAVGGHLAPGETIESGAVREYQEELGKPAPCLEFLHEYIWVSDLESELVRTYACVDEGPFFFDTEEIDDLRFFLTLNLSSCGYLARLRIISSLNLRDVPVVSALVSTSRRTIQCRTSFPVNVAGDL